MKTNLERLAEELWNSSVAADRRQRFATGEKTFMFGNIRYTRDKILCDAETSEWLETAQVGDCAFGFERTS